MMKVKVWVEAHADANVSLDDVIGELSELPSSERQSSILRAINAAHAIFQRVPVGSIAEMDEKQRCIIGNALREQADRYLPPNAVLSGAAKK